MGISCFYDAWTHMGEVMMNDLTIFTVTHGLHPGFLRWRRNWHATRNIWAQIMAKSYVRPLPDDATAEADGLPFWACLRRAYPDAMRDKKQYEDCMANFMLVYSAGLETTAGAIGMVLAVLALDSASMSKLEMVRAAPYMHLLRNC